MPPPFANDDTLAKEAQETFRTVVRALVMHDYLWDEHNVQMMTWQKYHRCRDQLRVLALRYTGLIPHIEIAGMKTFDAAVAEKVFTKEEWKTVQYTMDTVGKAHESLGLPFMHFDD